MHGETLFYGYRALAGQQAIDVHEVYRLMDPEGDPDLMPAHLRRRIVELLRALGYRERLVQSPERERAGLMWVRRPWPIDREALQGREVETFLPFD